MTGWDWLVVAGGGLQVIGVAGLAWEIRGLTRYLNRTHHVYGTDMISVTEFGNATVTGGRQPTPDERLDRMEAQVTEMRGRLDRMPAELAHKWRGDIAEQAARTERWMREALDDIERLALGLTPTRIRATKGFVAAVIVGLILATVGSVAS